MSSSDEQEFALHPDREEIRAALEGLEVDPATDVIIFSAGNAQGECRNFLKGNLREVISHDSLVLCATSVVVVREGKEIFRKDNIFDLFGAVFF